MAADTSSAPAASTPVVGADAAAVAVLTVDPIFARFEAASVTNSSAAITNDMSATFISTVLDGRGVVPHEVASRLDDLAAG